MKTITITVTPPDGYYCEDSPAPGARQTCRMLVESAREQNICGAFNVDIEEFPVDDPGQVCVRYHNIKCDECRDATKD